MRKENILFICLVIFLQTSLFAQISNTASVEIKDLSDVCYAKMTDIAMVDDTTSILFSEILENNSYKEIFSLVKEGSTLVRQVVLQDFYEVYDIEIYDRFLFFSGKKDMSTGFVAWADVNTFFTVGTVNYKVIPETSNIRKVKPYLTNTNTVNLACLADGTMGEMVLQVELLTNNYTISQIIPVQNTETYNDIIVYNDYIILAGNYYDGYSELGYAIRKYDKNNIANSLTYNITFIWNTNYENYLSYKPLLAKTKKEDHLCFATINKYLNSTNNNYLLHVYELEENSYSAIIPTLYFHEIDPQQVAITTLWDFKLQPTTLYEKGMDAVLLTYDGTKFSHVFHFDITYTSLGCDIFSYPQNAFFSSLELYGKGYFVSIGQDDISNKFTLWDRNIYTLSNSCDIYSNRSINPFLISFITPSFTDGIFYRSAVWERSVSRIYKKDYNIECSYQR